uniref:Uncharacterized protein n=1 Tax=Amphiprion percula TaxID=161767 RepID=A0A3P8UCY2_AMPPE
MELPFSGIELTFIIVAFVILSLYSLASVCIQNTLLISEEKLLMVQLVPFKVRKINSAKCIDKHEYKI